MMFRTFFTLCLLGIGFDLCAQNAPATVPGEVHKQSWYRIGLFDMYNTRNGYFSIGGHRQDTSYVPINSYGIVIGKQFEIEPWFTTSVVGDVSYGRGVLDSSYMYLQNGENRWVERYHDLVVVSLAMEGYCGIPLEGPIRPFLAARMGVHFASLNEAGITIDEDTVTLVTIEYGAHSSKILASVAFGAGIVIPLANRTAITFRYLYSRWTPVSYTYKDGMLTDGIPFVEIFHSHSFQLTFDWMHR
jgi:opacity protein-like surface antigen